MIMTSNTFYEGYKKLVDHFKVDPQVAWAAMETASQFCSSSQKCEGCLSGGSCADCKKRQEKEYKVNSGDLDCASLSEIIQGIKNDMSHVEGLKKDLAEDMEDLQQKIADLEDSETDVSDSIGNDFFKNIDMINCQLSEIEKKNTKYAEVAEHLDGIEFLIRNPVKQQKAGIQCWDLNKPQPSPKKKVKLTTYEKTGTFFGSETAERIWLERQ